MYILYAYIEVVHYIKVHCTHAENWIFFSELREKQIKEYLIMNQTNSISLKSISLIKRKLSA